MADRILLIEDDAALAKQIKEQLTEDGFAVTHWAEGRHIQAPDAAGLGLVILDLMLPGHYGLDILKELRTHAEVPVLILSARNDTFDKVRALQLGADDYMTKPFWPEELAERVRARLRRPILQRRNQMDVSGLEIDMEGRTVKHRGAAVNLTRVEFELLAALARRPGQAVSRTWLLSHIIDPDRGTERTLDVHFSRLRKKLGDDNPIETVWGVGYRLRAGDAA